MPHRLNVLVFVGDVRVVQINPIAHFLGHIVPLIGEAHDGFAAFFVVLLNANRNADVVFFDAQFFFNLQLNGQAVGVPAAFSFDLKTA